MTAPRLLVYGGNGYTARLLLSRLQDLQIEATVAGRNPARVAAVAEELGLPQRAFPLEDAALLDRTLDDVDVLVNAAGPFVGTAQPLVEACLRKRIDYLDLCGELGPLDQALSRDAAARESNVMLLPGIGFDVVPSDCLAVHVAQRLPDATALTLSVSPSNFLSHGSATTLAEHAGVPVQIRKHGALEAMRWRMQMRWVDFGAGARPTVAVSWGDLVTAFHSTRIRNIEVYFEATAFRWAAVAANQYCGWLLNAPGNRSWLKAFAELIPGGPNERQRHAERSVIVAEARRGSELVRSRLRTPDAYGFTAEAGAQVIQRVLQGARRPGFQTPAGLFGPDFVLSLCGVEREDLA
jgi:short subunit dehydrogenase-like uncharacterized protein